MLAVDTRESGLVLVVEVEARLALDTRDAERAVDNAGREVAVVAEGLRTFRKVEMEVVDLTDALLGRGRVTRDAAVLMDEADDAETSFLGNGADGVVCISCSPDSSGPSTSIALEAEEDGREGAASEGVSFESGRSSFSLLADTMRRLAAVVVVVVVVRETPLRTLAAALVGVMLRLPVTCLLRTETRIDECMLMESLELSLSRVELRTVSLFPCEYGVGDFAWFTGSSRSSRGTSMSSGH